MSRFETFTIETIKRSEIKGADYNPRIISKQAQNRLRQGIQEHGLVQPIIWNKRTGNVVGGHQRLAILDDLEAGQEYELQVSVVDLDQGAEKRLNVLLNNDGAQGHWDERKLLELFGAEEELDFEAYGFSANQGKYFADLMAKNDEENEAVLAAISFEAEIQDTADDGLDERHAEKLERKRQFEEKVSSLLVPQEPDQMTAADKTEYDKAREDYKHETFSYSFVTIAFDSAANRDRFLALHKMPAGKETIHESDLIISESGDGGGQGSSEGG